MLSVWGWKIPFSSILLSSGLGISVTKERLIRQKQTPWCYINFSDTEIFTEKGRPWGMS